MHAKLRKGMGLYRWLAGYEDGDGADGAGATLKSTLPGDSCVWAVACSVRATPDAQCVF